MSSSTSSSPSSPSPICPPATIPNLAILGFTCCACALANISSTRCDCAHRPCPSCTIFDHAGRVLSKHLAVGVHWLCRCGEFLPVVGTLLVGAESPCACGRPAFVALYNHYGRLCVGTGLEACVERPVVLASAGDVEELVGRLGRTAWGPGIRVAMETME